MVMATPLAAACVVSCPNAIQLRQRLTLDATTCYAKVSFLAKLRASSRLDVAAMVNPYVAHEQ